MVLDGPAGEALKDTFEKKGFKVLGFMENGFRHITNNVRPIKTPKDLDGIKLRTMEAPMHMVNFRALGANPTPVPFPELYMVLQQKIVDGQENPLMNIWEIKFYEVQKYVSLSGHIYDPMPLVANLDWFNKLSKEQQSILEYAGVQHKISTAIIYIFLLLNLVVTYQGFSILNDVHDQLTPALRIPVSVPYASIPVSFLFMVVYGISDILNQFKR